MNHWLPVFVEPVLGVELDDALLADHGLVLGLAGGDELLDQLLVVLATPDKHLYTNSHNSMSIVLILNL